MMQADSGSLRQRAARARQQIKPGIKQAGGGHAAYRSNDGPANDLSDFDTLEIDGSPPSRQSSPGVLSVNLEGFDAGLRALGEYLNFFAYRQLARYQGSGHYRSKSFD